MSSSQVINNMPQQRALRHVHERHTFLFIFSDRNTCSYFCTSILSPERGTNHLSIKNAVICTAPSRRATRQEDKTNAVGHRFSKWDEGTSQIHHNVQLPSASSCYTSDRLNDEPGRDKCGSKPTTDSIIDHRAPVPFLRSCGDPPYHEIRSTTSPVPCTCSDSAHAVP